MNRSLQAYRLKGEQKPKLTKQSKKTQILQTPIIISDPTQFSSSRKKTTVGIELDEDPNVIMQQILNNYRQELFKLQKEAEQSGKYVEAESYKRKIQGYKQQLQKYEQRHIIRKHQDERRQIQNAHQQQINVFNDKWDELLNKIFEQVKLVQEDLISRQEKELEQAFEKQNQEGVDRQNKFRESSQLLNLKKIEQELAKQQNYMEAHQVQIRVQKMEKQQYDKWKRQQLFKEKNTYSQIRIKHQTQLNAMKQRIQISLQEKNKQRKQEYQQLMLKYQNVMKQLEYQQNQQILKFNKKVNLGLLQKKTKASYGNEGVISKSRISLKN